MKPTAARPDPAAGSPAKARGRQGEDRDRKALVLILLLAAAALFLAEDAFGESPVDDAGEESESRLSKLQIEGFGARQQGDKTAYGGRTEILYQF